MQWLPASTFIPTPYPQSTRHNSSQPQQAAGYSCVIEIKAPSLCLMKSFFNIIHHLEHLNRLEDDLAVNPDTPHAAMAQCREIRALLPVELLEAHDQIRLSGNTSVAAMLFRYCGACCTLVDPALLSQPRLAGLFVICPHC